MEWKLFMSMKIVTYLIYVWGIWNIITFLLMGADKLIAKLDGWRISEATLLGTAFCMGAIGSFLGSRIFHHKTRKRKFQIGLPLALLVNAAVVCIVWYFVHY